MNFGARVVARSVVRWLRPALLVPSAWQEHEREAANGMIMEEARRTTPDTDTRSRQLEAGSDGEKAGDGGDVDDAAGVERSCVLCKEWREAEPREAREISEEK